MARKTARRASGAAHNGSRTRRSTKAAVTIRDVARVAGVSVATVSRVFNGADRVSPEATRDVHKAALRLRYRPNASARSLITSRSHTLGVLLPDMHGEVYSEMIRGAELVARETGYHLLVSSSHASNSELIAALHSMHGRVDGLIVMAPDPKAAAIARECSMTAPTVLLNPGGTVDGCSTVSIPNFEGAREATRHLLALGHERIAIVTGPDKNTDAAHRLEGFRAALREAGRRVSPANVLAGAFTEPSGYEAGRALLDLKPRPTAVFVANDRMAVGVIRALREAKLDLPDDMAIVGFDDIEMARYVTPALTTVHADSHGLGARAAEQLIAQLTGSESANAHHDFLAAKLIVRASCGAMNGKRTKRHDSTVGVIKSANRKSKGGE